MPDAPAHRPAPGTPSAGPPPPAGSPPGGWPSPGAGDRGRRRRRPSRSAVAVAGAALLVAGAGTTALAAGGHGGRRAATSAPGGRPVTWDPRILPLARFVERDRHLTFTHPVVVRFLPTAAFEQQVERSDTAGTAAPAGSGAPTDPQQAAELRALGVASGPIDLGAASAEADAASTVGYYDDQTKALYVEGTSLTPYVRVTVAHELTHALQDQRLDLSSLDRRPDDQQQAISALVEGDATVVEDDYRATLSAADEGAYEREAADAGSPAPSSGAAGYPDFLGDQGDFPYSLGPAFVDALHDHGGDDAVDQAFRDPPTTEAQIADPSRYLDHVTAAAVAAPALPAGARPLVDLGAFGQVSLADVLGTRVG
ncbi:MAG TPA: hypothetical protein VFP61_09960, partial [Acidimicrobiales bacterium]|nr:hypothetical protein [Acidimicrobiales bacterium]